VEKQQKQLKDYDQFLQKQKEILKFLSHQDCFTEVDIENRQLDELKKQILIEITPLTMISHPGQNKELQTKYHESLAQQGYIIIDT